MTNEELVQRIAAGDESYIPDLWVQVEKFVRWRANRFFFSYEDRCRSLLIDIDDLTQVGYFALLKSIETYDAGRGTKFLTVFEYQLKRQFFALAKMNYKGWEHNPIYKCTHLDAPLENADGLTLSDTLKEPTDKIAALEEYLYNESVQETIDEALTSLTERQREIITAIYFDTLTFDAAAKHFNISKGAVNTIVRAGRNKLRMNAQICALCTA